MKLLIWIAVGFVVIAGLVGVIILKPTENSPQKSETTQQTSPQATPQSSPTVATQTASTGRYAPYTNTAVNEGTYTETILFFHAPWCPECRAFEQAIEKSSIPAGVQILKVDYDSSSDLKSKYGVTLQSTFVKVDASGQKVSSWVGYGKDKSIDAILNNT